MPASRGRRTASRASCCIPRGTSRSATSSSTPRRASSAWPGRPRAGRAGRASASIDVYALLRDGLVRARKARQKLIRKELAVARGLAQTIDEVGPNARLVKMLGESLTMLRDYMSADAPYAGMARQMIEPALKELTG